MVGKNELTTKEAAKLLGVHESTLCRRRMSGYEGPPGPRFVRRFGRIFYLKDELERYKADGDPPGEPSAPVAAAEPVVETPAEAPRRLRRPPP